ncbi:hypothetical protein PR202_ga22510 [Eleusine coracana subsp. coracana]|uniref:Uncharacterized protein n=1 Tax=Eleusine coracana subsp. coracana TaxID=191504 RepID=A0AAV5D3P5_ELECO|nr:hypothetical protein PR202_ga22510 [Eleusine coracana subsp. coracana]
MSQSVSAIVADAVEGSHVLKIGGYSRTKGLSNGKYISSATFDVGGHRWYIRYYPDGNSSDNAGWISFFLHFQSTDASDEAEAALRFSLLDETGEPVPKYRSELSVRTFTTPNRGYGCGRFIEKKALEESTYLKDDCFRVRGEVIVSKEFRVEETKQFADVPPSNLHHHLGRLLSSKHGSDITFEVAGETFAAHRNILAARSPVFMAELFGPMKETTMTNIEINDIEARVFSAMLHFIYTDDLLPEIEKSDDMSVTMMAQHLLVVADRYDLERLKLMSEYKLCNRIDANTVLTTLALAEQHGCCGLKAACFEFLKSPKNLEAAMASDGFDHLITSCPSLIKELVAKVAACP